MIYFYMYFVFLWQKSESVSAYYLKMFLGYELDLISIGDTSPFKYRTKLLQTVFFIIIVQRR